MKTIIRSIVIYTFALYLLPKIIPGVHISGGLLTLFVGGIALAIMFLVIKPILNIISFPINLLTLGLFSIITNLLILYLLIVFVSGISIEPFYYTRADIAGFIVPRIWFNTFFAFVYTSFILSVIDSCIKWLMS